MTGFTFVDNQLVLTTQKAAVNVAGETSMTSKAWERCMVLYMELIHAYRPTHARNWEKFVIRVRQMELDHGNDIARMYCYRVRLSVAVTPTTDPGAMHQEIFDEIEKEVQQAVTIAQANAIATLQRDLARQTQLLALASPPKKSAPTRGRSPSPPPRHSRDRSPRRSLSPPAHKRPARAASPTAAPRPAAPARPQETFRGDFRNHCLRCGAQGHAAPGCARTRTVRGNRVGEWVDGQCQVAGGVACAGYQLGICKGRCNRVHVCSLCSGRHAAQACDATA